MCINQRNDVLEYEEHKVCNHHDSIDNGDCWNNSHSSSTTTSKGCTPSQKPTHESTKSLIEITLADSQT